MRAVAQRLGLAGRTTRTAFFGYLVFASLASVLLAFAALSALRHGAQGGVSPSLAMLPFWAVGLEALLALAALWLAIRRLHDQGRTGCYLLIVPALLGFTWYLLPIPWLEEGAWVALLIALLLPPTVGPNRHGPDPRGWTSREHWLEAHQAQRRSAG